MGEGEVAAPKECNCGSRPTCLGPIMLNENDETPEGNNDETPQKHALDSC